eukprot:10803_5
MPLSPSFLTRAWRGSSSLVLVDAGITLCSLPIFNTGTVSWIRPCNMYVRVAPMSPFPTSQPCTQLRRQNPSFCRVLMPCSFLV